MAKRKKEKMVRLNEDYDDLEGMYVPESWVPKLDDLGNGFMAKGSRLERYRGNDKEVVIPEGITEVKEGAFSDKSVVSVTIPKSLTKIRGDAFKFCSSLVKFVVAEDHPKFSVAGNCLIDTENKTVVIGLKSSVIPDDGSVTKIAEHAFRGRGWGRESNVIPETITEIGDHAFAGCGLIELTIPSSVKKIGRDAFGACDYLKTVVIEEGLTEISESAFAGNEYLRSVKLPESVTVIAKEAFYECENLEEINFPANLKEIGYRAFLWSNNWYRGIGGHLFINKNLKIDFSSFPRDGIESITVEEGNPYYYSKDNCLIEKGSETLIMGCKNSVIPSTVKKIGKLAFYFCNGLKEIVIPDTIEAIEDEAFEFCGELERIVIPDSVNEIGNKAFWCRREFWFPLNLKSVTMPKRFADRKDIFDTLDGVKVTLI